METDDRKWIVVRIDGKIAAVSTDYRMLASISAHLAGTFRHNDGEKDRKGRKKGSDGIQVHKEITATSISFDEVWRLRHETGWDDMMLFGTDFQKKVWRKLFDLTHQEDNTVRLISYTDFAQLCQNRAGVRAVAHAIGLNPVSVVIPCHLVVPKESIDKMKEINKKAEATIFKGVDLCLNSILKNETIDFGNYALGPVTKRRLITLELTGEEL